METAGKTLEELRAVFETPNPRKESTRRTEVAIDRHGNISEIDKFSEDPSKFSGDPSV